MWAAFLLGLTGSLGHCVGMCSGVAALLSRRGQARGWRLLFLHLGRVTTYSLMGAAAGGIGYAVVSFISYCTTPTAVSSHSTLATLPLLAWLQGGLALFTAVLAFYMALALIGRVPSPEILFIRITTWWGKRIRSLAKPANASPSEKASVFTIYSMGMLWGLLPCGLVMTGLVAAAVSGSPQRGALTMFIFGAGTWPVTVGISIVARLKNVDARGLMRPQFRYAASALIFIFGIQMTLRGLAAWEMVNHYHLGAIMLW